MVQRYGKFTGGIELPAEKDATLDVAIRPAEALRQLRVPLAPCGGHAALPVVAVGQSVEPGQLLARSKHLDAVDIFAPTGGEVRAITTAVTPYGHGLVRTPAIELARLGERPSLDTPAETVDWDTADPQSLAERIAEAQLPTFRLRPEPLAAWFKRAYSVDCRHLVVNAMENQPYVTADHRLLVEYGEQVLAGMTILARAAQIETVTLAVDRQLTGAYQHLVAPAADARIDLVALPRKYPVGADPILLKVLTRREVPCGGRPEDIGCAVIDPATCLGVYRWVAAGQRLTGRVMTLAGERIPEGQNLFVPFGASCHELAGSARPPLMLNGPMNGMLCDPDAVVSPSTTMLVATDPTPMGSPSQCIRCGWCRDHCPTRLNVSVLNDLFELGQIEQADRLGALACVQCGVCSYICPAGLPLSERLWELKSAIRRMDNAMPLFADMKAGSA